MTALMQEVTAAELTRARKELDREVAAKRMRLAAIPAERAAVPRQAGYADRVMLLDAEREQLEREIGKLEAQLTVAREQEQQALKRQRLADLAREIGTERDRLTAQERAANERFAGTVEAYRDWTATVWRVAELEQQLSGRPMISTLDQLRAPVLRFLSHAVARLFDWLWLRERPTAVPLTGPEGEAEKIIHKALFPDA